MDMLGSLGIGVCCFDAEDCTVAWNRSFLQLFPEHSGHIHVGEPYAENLRRFYSVRLDPDERAHLDRYVAEGIERHRNQTAPYEFRHRGQWLRVASLPVGQIGRARVWTPIAPPDDSRTIAKAIAGGGRGPMVDSLASIGDGLLVTGGDGRITLANARFAELYGLEAAASAVGLTFEDVLGQAWGGQEAAALAAVADHRRFPGAPYVVPLPGDRWVRCIEQRGADGGIVSTHADVSDMHRLQRETAEARQRAERLAASLTEKIAELEASNQRIELLLKMMPGGLLRVRWRGEEPMEILYRSPEIEKLTGIPLSEMVPGILVSRIGPEERTRLRDKVRDVVMTGCSTTIELNFRHANGAWRRMHGSISTTADARETGEAMMLWTDVTDERERLIEDAQTARLLTLGEMASGIAHELNQPLSTISLLTATAAMALQRFPDQPDLVLSKLHKAGEQAQRAGRIIHTLHDMTRPDQNALGPVCLREAVEATRSLVDQMMINAGVVLTVNLPMDLPKVLGDQTRIQQTLMNLLSNARDAIARTGTQRPAIRITASATAEDVYFEIADNGGGVDPAVIGRVFDPFFTTKGPDQGTGLGLSIARSAIHSMQGEISLRNANGGAVFTLRLRVWRGGS